MKESEEIYYEGNKSLIDKNLYYHLGIVGSRNILGSTKIILESLFEELSSIDNLVILSGGMYGVDIFVHNLCLKYNIGTIFFLPSGNKYFKKSSLFRLLNLKSTSNFLFVSRYDEYFSPRKYTFLERNKQLIEFSECNLIAQSALNSGSYFSGNYSLSINKRTFSIPFSPLDTQFIGNNLLISKGAGIYLSSSDFIEKLGIIKKSDLTIETIISFLPNSQKNLENKFSNVIPHEIEKILLKGILEGKIFFEEGVFIKNDK